MPSLERPTDFGSPFGRARANAIMEQTTGNKSKRSLRLLRSLRKQETGGLKNRKSSVEKQNVSVRNLHPEKETSMVGEPILQTTVGKPTLLSIYRGGYAASLNSKNDRGRRRFKL